MLDFRTVHRVVLFLRRSYALPAASKKLAWTRVQCFRQARLHGSYANDKPESNLFISVPKIKLFQNVSHFEAWGVGGCGTQIHELIIGGPKKTNLPTNGGSYEESETMARISPEIHIKVHLCLFNNPILSRTIKDKSTWVKLQYKKD